MKSDKCLYEAYETLPCGIIVFSIDKNIKLLYANKYYYDNFSDGIKNLFNIYAQDEILLKTAVGEMSGSEPLKTEYNFSVNGESKRASVLISVFNESSFLGVISDITECYSKLHETQEEKQRFEEALCRTNNIVFESDALARNTKMYIPSKNGRGFDIMSMTGGEDRLTVENLHPNDRSSFFERICNPAEKTLALRMKLKNDNDWKWYRIDRQFGYDDDGKPVRMFGIINDIDKEKTHEKELQQQLEIDSELKIYNRNAAVSKINMYLSKQTGQNKFALLVLDIDDFKNINDTYGHLYGDAVIAMVAEKLRELAEHCGIVGRYGGDEFFVFLEDMKRDEIIDIADKILHSIASLRVAGDGCITCSIGIALSDMFDTVPKYKDMFEKADKALYSVKRNGKAQWRTYDEDTMGGDMGGHAIDYEAEDNAADEELLKSRDLTKVFIELSADEKTSDAAMYKIIRYIAEKFNIDWFQIMQVNCTEDLVTIKYEWCSDTDFKNNAGRSGYYVHSDIARFRECFEKNPIFVITPESTDGFSPKFQREFEKNMRYSAVYIANITANDTFYMFVCTRFDKDNKWKDDEAFELNTATKLMTMYVSQADRETDNERRYREMVDFERKTGLYTMAKFYEQLGRLRKIAAENDEEVAIIHTDFHRFINFNRQFGLEAGDNMLIGFANSIQRNDDPEHSIATHIDSTDIFISAKRIAKGDRSFIDAIDKINKNFCNEQNKIYNGANIILKSGIYILKRNDTGGDALDWAVMAKDEVKDFNESFCAVYEG